MEYRKLDRRHIVMTGFAKHNSDVIRGTVGTAACNAASGTRPTVKIGFGANFA